jgi:hypothetical protein
MSRSVTVGAFWWSCCGPRRAGNFGPLSITAKKAWSSISDGLELRPGIVTGPFLDPMSEQTPYAPALLNLFKFILRSPGYERLKKHYQLFRAAVDEEFAKRNPTLRFPEAQRRAR